jgi:hypothetical protein
MNWPDRRPARTDGGNARGRACQNHGRCRRPSGQLPVCWLRSACTCSRLASGIVQMPSEVPRMIDWSPGVMTVVVISKPGVNSS